MKLDLPPLLFVMESSPCTGSKAAHSPLHSQVQIHFYILGCTRPGTVFDGQMRGIEPQRMINVRKCQELYYTDKIRKLVRLWLRVIE